MMKSRNRALPKILAIVGPTASGKSELAIKLAKELNGEIVSADSRQIYRGMDIGTAKPFKQKSRIKYQESKIYLSAGIPHHLIDIKNPDEDYTVAEYKRDAIKAIKNILKRGKLPILVGGTGLYVKAVAENLDIPHVKANRKLRRELEMELKAKGPNALFEKLVARDPEAAYVIDPRNPRRVIRALEVALTTGKPFTTQRKKGAPFFGATIIGIRLPRATLKTNIEKRVDEMILNGLVEETKTLYEKYGKCPPEADGPRTRAFGGKALEAIGYREIIDYLDGNISLAEAIRQIKINTRHYVKRQMTWFKKDKSVHWAINLTEAGRFIHQVHPPAALAKEDAR